MNNDDRPRRGADGRYHFLLSADLAEARHLVPLEPLERRLGTVTRGINIPSLSTTQINGRLVNRAAIVNHRTEASDVHGLVDAVLAAGRERTAKAA